MSGLEWKHGLRLAVATEAVSTKSNATDDRRIRPGQVSAARRHGAAAVILAAAPNMKQLSHRQQGPGPDPGAAPPS